MVVGMADVGAPLSFEVTNVTFSGIESGVITWMGNSTSLGVGSLVLLVKTLAGVTGFSFLF